MSPSASEFYAAADRPLALKLARCFCRLEADPRRGNNVKRLQGEWSGYLRYRVGDWRVIDRIDDADSRVNEIVIAHRREVYESSGWVALFDSLKRIGCATDCRP